MILSVGLKSNFLKVLLWGLEQDTAYSQTLHGRIRGLVQRLMSSGAPSQVAREREAQQLIIEIFLQSYLLHSVDNDFD